MATKKTKKSTREFFAYMQDRIARLHRRGRFGTCQNYERAYRSLRRFYGDKPLSFRDLDEDLVADYEHYLRLRGVKRNSISFYMRVLRAVYKSAVAEGYAKEPHPFGHVFTGTEKTRKRAVDIAAIKELKALDLSMKPSLAYVRDLFLLSLYLRGMTFVDLAYICKRDLSNGFLDYHRHKSDARLTIKIEPCMQEIIDRYKNKDKKTPYLLDILKSNDEEEAYLQYQSALTYYNRQLKCLNGLLGNSVSLSSYTARHTWASVAHGSCIPIALISEGMGHSSEKVTQIYIASLESSLIDQANSEILKLF